MKLYINGILILNNEYERTELEPDIEYFWDFQFQRSYVVILYDIDDGDKLLYLAINIKENETGQIIIPYKMPADEFSNSHEWFFQIYLQPFTIPIPETKNIDELIEQYNLKLISQRSFTVIG